MNRINFKSTKRVAGLGKEKAELEIERPLRGFEKNGKRIKRGMTVDEAKAKIFQWLLTINLADVLNRFTALFNQTV